MRTGSLKEVIIDAVQLVREGDPVLVYSLKLQIEAFAKRDPHNYRRAKLSHPLLATLFNGLEDACNAKVEEVK